MKVTDSTRIGGDGGAFPSTSWTLLRQAADLSSADWQSRLGALLFGAGGEGR